MVPLSSLQDAAASNVIPFRLGIAAQQVAYLADWLKAGRSMGLLDAEPGPRRGGAVPECADHVLVWVRENPDPAYMVRAEGFQWVVIDNIRAAELGRFRTFESALQYIRPVTARAKSA